VYVVLRRLVRGGSWRPDRAKLRQSILANLLLLSFAAAAWESFHVHTQFSDTARDHPVAAGAAIALLVGLFFVSLRVRTWLGRALQVLGRLLVRPGLFENFERRRFLAAKIDGDRLKRSPMRVLLTATDLESGTARFFCNGAPEALAADPGADPRFVAEEVSPAHDLMSAVMASSALPIVYEPMPMGAHTFGDGGIVANQPIRPALRLGADMVFLVMVDAPGARHPRLDTFVDVGRRALDILIQQNMVADLATLDRFNTLCLEAARQANARPEEIEVNTGRRRYRYVRPFTIRPREELGTGILDFGDPRTVDVIARGYQDACEQLREALIYVDGAPLTRPRRALRMAVAGEA
jgi:predicted acylesterase/phospholipase RssA